MTGRFFQPVEYEGITHICFKCGHVGHRAERCNTVGISGLDDNKRVGVKKQVTNSNDGATSQADSSQIIIPNISVEASLPKEKMEKGKATATCSSRNEDEAELAHGAWMLVSRRRPRNYGQRKEAFKPWANGGGKPPNAKHADMNNRWEPVNQLKDRSAQDKLKGGEGTTGREGVVLFSATRPTDMVGGPKKGRIKIGRPKAHTGMLHILMEEAGPDLEVMRKKRRGSSPSYDGGDASPLMAE